MAEEDLGRHVRIRTAERQAFAFLFVARRDAGESEIRDFETAVGGDEEVFAFEVAVDAFAGVQVGERACDVGGEGEA